MERMGVTIRRPTEFRERAVRMLREWQEQRGKTEGGFLDVARQLGVHPETLRGWVKRADIDSGARPGLRTEDRARVAELERENRELRRANEILKTAAAFFARELDPRQPR